jgi:hypothetical protein
VAVKFCTHTQSTASAAAVMIGVKAIATMARVKCRDPDDPV